jgi:hypothetical protein
MWRYTPTIPIKIIKKNIIDLIEEIQDYIPDITDEAVAYLNDLYSFYIDSMNEIDSDEMLNRFYETLPTYVKENMTQQIVGKTNILNALLMIIIWDNDHNEKGITRNVDVITPWVIKDYIHNHRDTRDLFHLPNHHNDNNTNHTDDDDIDYVTTPVTVPINVKLNGIVTILDITYELLLGVMAVYRHFHLMHPFSYGNHIFAYEMEIVNSMAFKPPTNLENYFNINVGNDVFSFDSTDFFQGLLTGAKWINIDPHTFITGLKQWKVDQPVHTNGPIPTFPIQIGMGRKYTIDLIY